MKYSRQELIEMAKVVEKAKAKDDPRYLQFILSVALKTEQDPQKIMDMTSLMAKSK